MYVKISPLTCRRSFLWWDCGRRCKAKASAIFFSFVPDSELYIAQSQRHLLQRRRKSRVLLTTINNRYEDVSLPLEWKAIKKFLSEELDRFDGVIISDYGKGMVGLPLIRFLSKECARRKICLSVDPKISHFSYYRNVDCLTPNRMEAILGYGVAEPKSQEELFSLGRKIRKDLSLKNLVITQGKEGMSLFTDKGASSRFCPRILM